ncbi:MAG: phytanoyl-CoA dioxygenase family protein [Microcystaceae cyanobacterium]
MLTKFSLTDTEAIKQYYEENGYVIVSQLLDDKLIDNFLKQYKLFKLIPFRLIRSQDTNRGELLRKDKQGFIVHSIHNPMHDVPFAWNFSRSVQDCVTITDVSHILQLLSGRKIHTIWQTMFFDKSTGTVAHQDSYYLDTDPTGHLIAAWFALEDIHPDSGCFFVVPGSHKTGAIENKEGVKLFSDHEDFVERTQRLIDDNHYKFKPCPLSKGDVLFWHPFTIHGAFPNLDPKYSRKSFTAHYYPEGYQIKNHAQPPKTTASNNQDIQLWSSVKYQNSLKWNIKRYYELFSEYLKAQIYKERPMMEMRSVEYNKEKSLF